MNYEIEGTLIVKEETQQVSDKFSKREFVIEVINSRNTDYNDFIKFQLTKDKCSAIDNYNIGDTIKVFFNIRGRKWEKDGKVNYFSNLEAWKLDGVHTQVYDKQTSVMPENSPINEPSDDLPF